MKKVIFLSAAIAFSFLECAESQHLRDEDRRPSGASSMVLVQVKPIHPRKLPVSTFLLKSPQQRGMHRFHPRQHKMDTPMSGNQSRR